MDKAIYLKPRMSEKAYALSMATNTYVFDVPEGLNKHSVARAVAAQYEVTVVNVNISNLKGKAKRTVRKNGRAANGKQNDVRKAYVTLKAGDKLPVFAAIEEEQAKAEEAAAKAEKKGKK